MNRPWVIWCLSGLIALLVFGAMGVITQYTLGLEKETAQAEARAELEGRIRIALWRMDTYAAGILAEENNRPAWHFRDVDMQRATRLTPLNIEVPDNVNLHFEVHNGQLSTPQVNGWGRMSSAWDASLVPVQQGEKLSAQKQNDFKSLKNLLYNDDTFKGWQTKRNTQSTLADNNFGVICAVAHHLSQDDKVSHIPAPETQQKIAIAQQQRLGNTQAEVRNLKGYQTNYNEAEKAKRKEIVQQTVNNRAASKKAWGKGKGAKQGTSKNEVNQDVIPAKPVVDSKAVKVPDKIDQSKSTSSADKSVDDAILNRLKIAEEDVVEGAYQSPLKPIWMGGELVLIREVQDGKGKRIQGVWLDADKIRRELLKNIHDLLPEAKLEEVKQGVKILLGEVPDPNANDPLVLAALPWRLLPGEVAVASPVGWTPMRKTLAVAWVGALLAAFAAMALLRGVVRLSERRASFVSSVTHELRTPLTTFSLYSDMLAEGMVRDEGKKQNYLDTLRKESARLTHLVENVLAYSRIERGSARARVEEVEVGSLIDRMCERLRKRAEEDGMELRCEVPDDLVRQIIKIDTTAVEQIVFNLVDNASKYASGDEERNVITLRTLERGKQVVFQVKDQGPGIASAERKKLFRAFHKSAQEAAHTKSGVGLGLALCRRLARALGGDLCIVDCEEGACFELLLAASK